jgi:hypothetical protein
MTKRPTFFLSSTIYDFRDLRGAIKFALEERGCKVLASEFNDFAVDPKAHSYEACLKNIAEADYFVLLVGGRVGGWYDQANLISITRQEYREAYRIHKESGLRIVTLVRSEVWQAREDRKALAKHLSGMELNEEQKRQIVDFPSKFTENAEFVSAFLNEIGRNQETIAAVTKGTPKPTGNWIYPFSTFKEINDVLQPLTFSGLTADEASYRKALQYELIELLRRLLLKHKGKALDPRGAIRHFWQTYSIEVDRIRSETIVDVKEWMKFSVVMLRLMATKIKPVVINDALASPIFLDYDSTKNAYITNRAYELLSRLVDEIGMFNHGATSETFSIIYEFSPKRTGLKQGMQEIPCSKLAILIGLGLRWFNIISICESLAKHLEGAPLQEPILMPFSPSAGMQEQIDQENVTSAEARIFLGI